MLISIVREKYNTHRKGMDVLCKGEVKGLGRYCDPITGIYLPKAQVLELSDNHKPGQTESKGMYAENTREMLKHACIMAKRNGESANLRALQLEI